MRAGSGACGTDARRPVGSTRAGSGACGTDARRPVGSTRADSGACGTDARRLEVCGVSADYARLGLGA